MLNLVNNVDVSELSSAATDISGLLTKTAGISKTGPITTVEGVDFAQGHMDADYVLTDGLKVNGISELDELKVNGISNLDGVRVHNGSIHAENDSYVGGVQLADGLVNGVDMDNLKGIEGGDYGNGAHYTTIEGVTTFDKDGMGVYTDTGASVIGGGRATFNDGESTTSIIGGAITAKTLNGKVIDDLVEGSDIADDLANVSGITRTDENNDGKLDTTTIEGSTSFDANGMNVGNGAVAANADGSFSAANGAFDVNENGKIEANFSETGTLYADEIGFDVEHYTSDHSTYLSAYEDYVGMSYNDADQYNEVTVDENRAGLTHRGENNFSRVSVSDSGVGLIYVSEDPDAKSPVSTISMTDEGIEFSGKVYTGNANDFSFTYNGYTGEGGLTIENGTVAAGTYTLDDLVDTVADIYERTQGISYDSESGTTTIDGNLNVSGDAETGEGGNENVSGDINAGGDITADGDVNGSNGNFDKVTTGEISADKGNIGNSHFDENGITVGAAGGQHTTITDTTVDATNGYFDNLQADKADIGGVGLEGGTVTADKVVTGNTTLDNEGLNVGGQTSVTADGVNVGGNGGTTVSKDGVSIADKTIISDHDVVINEGTADRVSLSETADRVSNVEQGVAELNNRVGELEDRIDKVGAMAAAIANLRTMGYDPAAPTEVAVGIGQYRDETGAALGLFHYPNRDFMLSLSVSTSGDEVMGGIGATWKFGRKSPEKVAEIKKAQAEADARRAEEAKLAKAEEMKQAAKEAKIKAQQERHAKLAAERAAQAEAAK